MTLAPFDEAAALGEPPHEQFWADLRCAVCNPCASHEEIDDALRAWLGLVAAGRDRYLADEDALARCSRALLASPLFAAHGPYVHTQIVYSLLQEDEACALHAIANYLLLAGRADEAVFQRMLAAGCFGRLVELLPACRATDDRRLHRLLLALLYEMARIERLPVADLLHVDDGFVHYLFQSIEDLSDDDVDPYHYGIIRVLLVLNEQYMVAATTAAVDPMSPAAPLTNRVLKVLGLDGARYRTFGENLILLLNRETETSLQLLILKLLYLLFTTRATYEYFYTNDLRVLLDVIIRNLLDLPNEAASLRHTYLRVLYPLLAHTQLNQPPQYKRDEILRVLAILCGAGNAHFAPADATTLRLVDRVSRVGWLETEATTGAPAAMAAMEDMAVTEEQPETALASPASPTGTNGTTGTTGTAGTAATTTTARTSTASSADSATGDDNDDDGGHHVAAKLLGISLTHEGQESRASVVDVAAVTEKPGVKTPSRKAVFSEAELASDDKDWTEEKGKEKEQQQQQQQQHNQGTVPTGGGDDSQPIPAVMVEFEPREELLSQKYHDAYAAPGGKETVQGEHHNGPAPEIPTTAAATTTAAVPPERKPRSRRALPAVPKHRHGVLMRPPPVDSVGNGVAVLDPATAAAGATDGATTAASAAAAVTHAHAHAHANGGIKKLPPKAPPPRRAGRLKQAASSANLQAAVESGSV
ncbi:hypothetical protein SPI_08770 [Niveomyces insectorum RCEF 264]|uniref:SPIN90/Ldb17 leucine-rich domain-containing protein n=1 Tax=Niveomyces insectorum RCEF 264 TaxID=1081102 RepID=A0A167MM32_9HYPO|nr:hypothetical protein SPI_08770 [Niveomyces insectorum RCEF 264]